MTVAIIIGVLMFLGYLLIATERFTGINRSAVAMFLGTLGWMLYVSFGSDFVMANHAAEYQTFLSGIAPNSDIVKEFIAQNVFIKYVGKAAEIVLFLLSTMTIVEILNNSGCFDFLSKWLKMRNSRILLLLVGAITIFVSANLDNLTTTVMLIAIIHKILSNRKQRIVFATAIVISANIGGALTVIGDTNGLMLWHLGAVSASHYTAWMLLPCLSAWALTMFLLSRMLPERVDIERHLMSYRGDDTQLKLWQRMLLFFLAIAGLWFIPTFHNITHLSPFLGALCALSIVWVVNEVFNRRHMLSGQNTEQRLPLALQYSRLKTLLFVMGIMLCIGVMIESHGTIWLGEVLHNSMGEVFTIYVAPIIAAIVSTFMDTFATASLFYSLFSVEGTAELGLNGEYWILIAYATAVGGNILCIGSLSGIMMMDTENVTLMHYLKKFTPKIIAGALVGLSVLIAEVMFFD